MLRFSTNQTFPIIPPSAPPPFTNLKITVDLVKRFERISIRHLPFSRQTSIQNGHFVVETITLHCLLLFVPSICLVPKYSTYTTPMCQVCKAVVRGAMQSNTILCYAYTRIVACFVSFCWIGKADQWKQLSTSH